MELATLLRREGRTSEAIEAVRVLLDSHPEEARLWRRELAVLYVAKGDVEGGLGDLRALAEEAPDEVAGWLVLDTTDLSVEAAVDRILEHAEIA